MSGKASHARRMLALTALALTAGLVGAPGAAATAAAGPVYPVPSTIPADCSRPVEGEIESFLATVPDGSTVSFAPGGCYGQDRSLWIHSRNNLTLDGNGSTFKIVTSARNTEWFRSNIRIREGSGVTLRHLTVVGACKPDECRQGTPPPQPDGYGQHGVNLESTASPTLDDVHIVDALSDGVSVQGTLDPMCCWKGVSTSNLRLVNSHIERAGRQLVGITALDGGLIQNNVIENGPQTGIDIELDAEVSSWQDPLYVGRDIRILGNTFRDVWQGALVNGGLGSDPDVGNIEFSYNTVYGTQACADAVWLRTPGIPPDQLPYRTRYTFKGNRAYLIGRFIKAERINELDIRDNVVSSSGRGTCGEKAAVELYDSHDASFSSNTIEGYPARLYLDPTSNAVGEDPAPPLPPSVAPSAAPADGREAHPSSDSPAVTRPRKRTAAVTLKAAVQSARAAKTAGNGQARVRLYGRASGSETGSVIVTVRRLGGGQALRRRVAIDRDGRFAAVLRRGLRPGAFGAHARYVGAASAERSVSASVRFTIRP